MSTLTFLYSPHFKKKHLFSISNNSNYHTGLDEHKRLTPVSVKGSVLTERLCYNVRFLCKVTGQLVLEYAEEESVKSHGM